MIEGRSITDENWINSSMEFNQWIKDNGDHTVQNEGVRYHPFSTQGVCRFH